jgi:hypothetical protein
MKLREDQRPSARVHSDPLIEDRDLHATPWRVSLVLNPVGSFSYLQPIPTGVGKLVDVLRHPCIAGLVLPHHLVELARNTYGKPPRVFCLREKRV